ncbi:BatD family protein, partial [Myxococcota bacterium]|nr:BatD family protein [Myxococcota bacterium]
EGQNPDPKYGKDIFAQAFIDRKQAYVGQPVVVTWYAYTFSRLSETPVSQLPDAPGFFNKTLLDKARFIGRVNVGSAVMLQYLLYRRVYWPQRNGELVIGARSIQLSTRDSIFSGKQYVRSTAPIKIKVLPLPTKGRPKDFFDDNVGRFSFKSDLSATSLKTNEAIDVTFTIKGEGLISAVKMGKLPALDWARLEPNGMPVVKERISGQKRVSGESQNRYILIPLKPGKHTFPAVEFAYFDPQSAKYRVARTKAVTFSVAPSGKAYNPMISASGPTATAKDNVLAPKIKPLHVQTIRGSSLRASFTGGALFWILLLVPPLGWALLGIGLLFHRRRRGDVAGKKRRELRYRRRESFKKAHQYLKSSSSPDYYGELSKIITDAVSHRIGRSAHGLTTEELAEALRRSQASQDCIDLVLETLESFDFARYAPAASSDTRAMETALSSTKSLLSRIDRLELMEVQS